jgi:hypothetical protein
MNQPRIFSIAGQTDIVFLRMTVRDVARAQGLSLADQARISLAVSSFAEAIDVSSANPGQAIVSPCFRDGRTGLQVTYLVKDDDRGNWSRVLGNVKWMVDETSVDQLSADQIQVTLTKWKV